MRNIMQSTIRMIVAFGIAVVGIITLSEIVAYSSSVERAWVIKQEGLASRSRSSLPKSEFRLSEYQQLYRGRHVIAAAKRRASSCPWPACV